MWMSAFVWMIGRARNVDVGFGVDVGAGSSVEGGNCSSASSSEEGGNCSSRGPSTNQFVRSGIRGEGDR